jgi:N-acetylmuramoyl-L-alanine amidase
VKVDIQTSFAMAAQKFCRSKLSTRLLSFACCTVMCSYFLLHVSAAEPDKLSVYAPQARYSLPVLTFDGRQYVGLLDLAEPLGTPELRSEGKKWRLRVPDPKSSGKFAEAEFEERSTTARIRGRQSTLSAPARVENHRLLVPLHGIGTILIPLLGTDVTFHEAARRLFLGGTASAISTELRKGETSILALHFAEAVNPNIHSEGNALVLSFTRDPVVSFSENQALNDKLFNSSTYEETNGAATLTINGNTPLLAQFTDNGRTILISAAPPPPVQTAAASPARSEQPQQSSDTGVQALGPGEPVLPGVLPPPTRRPATPAFVVVIDPGHGGTDTGARITPNLPEKEITLSLARKLRQELQARHVAVSMLRDSDSDITLEQRVIAANLARPSVLVSLHAEPGDSLRIYTPVLPAASDAPLERGSFLPWQSAQGAFSAESSSLASAAVAALDKRKMSAQVRPAFLQPLHSVAAPAIAVEVPADAKGTKIPEDRIADALAEAIAQRKPAAGGTQ